MLPLLDSDLAELALPCCTGACRDGARATTGRRARSSLPPPGYPTSPMLGDAVTGSATEADVDGTLVFPAGTRRTAVTAAGGCWPSPDSATRRRGRRQRLSAHGARSTSTGCRSAATSAGVPPARAGVLRRGRRRHRRGQASRRQMKDAVERTHGPAVATRRRQLRRRVQRQGDQGDGRPGARRVDRRRRHEGRARRPARVATAGVGADIVNHCIDDVLVQGARPLFFLDYIASSKIDAEHVAEVVTGMAEACAAAGCALLGGETAEMPGVYAPGAFDIAGTLVGVVERARPAAPRRHRRRRRARSASPQRSAHQRLLAAAQDVPVAADGRHAARLRPPARRRTARAASQLPRRARRAPWRRSREGARAHHRRRPARRTCRGSFPTMSTPPSSSARGPCRRCSNSYARSRPASTRTSSTAR